MNCQKLRRLTIIFRDSFRVIISRNFSILFDALYVFFLFIFFGRISAIEGLSRINSYSLPILIRLFGAKIGKNSNIQRGVRFHNCKSLKNLSIGEACHIGKNAFIDLREKVVLGDRVVIAMNVTLLTHLDMGESKLSSYYPPKAMPLYLENDVYVGEGTSILMGVTIGECCLIGARSLITKPCNGYSLYAGVPATRVKDIYVKK
ncbi:acyltransferase [Vibrio vulnificus]|nr:acyltransferase [Vibrio vulnificus]